MEIEELRNKSLDALQQVIRERSTEKAFDHIIEQVESLEGSEWQLRRGKIDYYVNFMYTSTIVNLKKFEHTLCYCIAESDVDNQTFFDHLKKEDPETALELFYIRGAHTFEPEAEEYKTIYIPYWDILEYRNVDSRHKLFSSMDEIESLVVEEHEDRWEKAEELMFSY